MPALYDTIGLDYARLRQPDPTIQRAIDWALGDAETILNVGAGAGSYEPSEKRVVAVEPSVAMLRQRPDRRTSAVQGDAMELPFRNGSFDASMAILTVHHWPDKRTGLSELCRVSRRRIVIFTWDPGHPGFWLTDYFPEILDIDRPIFPSIKDYSSVLGGVEVIDVPVPHDCKDGFLCAYWRRPAAYLDEHVRSSISTFAKITDIGPGLARLTSDIDSGAWHKRYGELFDSSEMDMGYRVLVAVR